MTDYNPQGHDPNDWESLARLTGAQELRDRQAALENSLETVMMKLASDETVTRDDIFRVEIQLDRVDELVEAIADVYGYDLGAPHVLDATEATDREVVER